MPRTSILHSDMFRRSARMAARLALALATTLAAACATAKPSANPHAAASRAPAIRPTETFDAAWTMVRDEHFDATLNGVDWNAVRDELRPRAANAGSAEELREVLNEMLARLGQSHFTIIPAESEPAPAPQSNTPIEVAKAAAPGAAVGAQDDSGLAGIADAGKSTASADTNAQPPSAGAVTAPSGASAPGPGIAGVDIALVEGQPTVLRVSPGLAGARAGVLTGWRLVSVDGMGVDDRLDPIRAALAEERNADSPQARRLRAMLAFTGSELLSGEAGTQHSAVFTDASGAEQRVQITLEPAPLGSTKYGNLPAFPIEVESRVMELPADGGKPVRIGIISFNIWMTGASDAIDRAVDSLRNCDGIVLDLRGNPGGLGAMSMGVAGHFLREPASLGSMIGRDNTMEFTASPRKVSADGKRVRPYSTKPLAILVDGRSASTSEVFAGGLQDLGRARVFGENSAGMALPAQAHELPNGDVLLHAVADFVTSKGTRLEGRGVIPDEKVAPNRSALLRGEDSALIAAGNWISRSTADARAARANPAKPGSGAPDSSLIPSSMPTAMPSAAGTP